MILAAAPVAPLSWHSLLIFLLQVSGLLLFALCLGRQAVRLGMPALVGELISGLLLGPSVFGLLVSDLAGWLMPAIPDQTHLIDAVSQLGVVLLVGISGTQLDVSMIRRRSITAARVSLLSLAIPLGLGVVTAYLLPASIYPGGVDRPVFALFLGVAMPSPPFGDSKDFRRHEPAVSRRSPTHLVAAMVDDTMGWLLLSIVSAMATIGVNLGVMALNVLYLGGVIIAAATVGRPLVRIALRAAATSTEDGPIITTAVIIILLGASMTQALKLEPVFGAFLAGIVISSSHAASLEKLAPLRALVMSVLAPLFLASAGLRIDLTALAAPTVLMSAIAVLLVAIIGKFTGAYLGARLSRLNHWEGIALSAGMNARGVVQIVVAAVGLRLAILNTATYMMIVLVAITISLMAGPVLRCAMAHVTENPEERRRKTTQSPAR
jgi:Kef-type K+ transport system membrane component KefB